MAYLDYSSAEEDGDSGVQIVLEKFGQFSAGRFGIEFTQTYYFWYLFDKFILGGVVMLFDIFGIFFCWGNFKLIVKWNQSFFDDHSFNNYYHLILPAWKCTSSDQRPNDLRSYVKNQIDNWS